MTEFESESWDARLDNWAIWLVGRPNASGSSNWDMIGRGQAPSGGTVVSPYVGDAIDVDRLIILLSADHQAVLHERYVKSGNPDEKAARLAISRSTYYERIISAKQRLCDFERERKRRTLKSDKTLGRNV